MYAVEFQARIRNGIIEIPEEFRDRFREYVRVILLAEEKRSTADAIDRLLEDPLRIENFVPLTREEAHERE